MEIKRGGFSEALWRSQSRKTYTMNAMLGGYFSSCQRGYHRDKIVEEALRTTGLGDEGASLWLTSVHARHLLDDVSADTKMAEFHKIVVRNTRDAFLQVTIWSHPDHTGSAASTEELTAKLKAAICTGKTRKVVRKKDIPKCLSLGLSAVDELITAGAIRVFSLTPKGRAKFAFEDELEAYLERQASKAKQK